MHSKIINFRSPLPSRASQPNQAVALCRVSTEDQFIKGLSVPEQRSRIEKWADDNNVTVSRWVEIPHSAYRGLEEEPEVVQLVEFAKNNPGVSYFLVDEKSRLARRKYLRVVWQEELRRCGVQVVGVSEPVYDRNTIHGIWMEGISETKDEARSIEIAYHTAKGMTRNAETRDPETGHCYKNGGVAPDGYRNKRVIRGKDSRGKDIVKLLWEADPDRAMVVKHMILDLWMQRRLSYAEIRDRLNGVTKSADETFPVSTLNRKGKPWSKTTIREICIRGLEGVYSGYYYWNRTGRDLRGTGQKWKDASDWVVVENAHPAIISREELKGLQAVMEPVVTRNKARKKIAARTDGSPYLFSGENSIGETMFVCLNCGEAVNGQQVARVKYYLCSGYKNRGLAGCDKGVSIRQKQVETAVVEAIKRRFTNEYATLLADEINNIIAEENKDQSVAVAHMLGAIKNTDRKIAGVMSAIEQAQKSTVLGILIKRLEILQQEKTVLEQELAELQREQPLRKAVTDNKLSGKVILERVSELEQMFRGAEASNKEKRMAVRYFVRQLQFDPETRDITIYFWPTPGDNNHEKLQLNKNKAEAKSALTDIMISGGAGNRNRPVIIKLQARN